MKHLYDVDLTKLHGGRVCEYKVSNLRHTNNTPVTTNTVSVVAKEIMTGVDYWTEGECAQWTLKMHPISLQASSAEKLSRKEVEMTTFYGWSGKAVWVGASASEFKLGKRAPSICLTDFTLQRLGLSRMFERS